MNGVDLNIWGEFKNKTQEKEFQEYYWLTKKNYFFISYFTCTFLFSLHGLFDFDRIFVHGSPEILVGMRATFLAFCLYFIYSYKDLTTPPPYLYYFCFFLNMCSVAIIFFLTIFTKGQSLTLHLGTLFMVAAFYICLPSRALFAFISANCISLVFIFLGSPELEGLQMHIGKSFILISSNVILWFYHKGSQKFQRIEFISSHNLKTIADMKGKFLTTLAHDLRTPLTIVAGRNRMIQKRIEKLQDIEAKKVYDHTVSIADNIKTINDLIEGLIHWTVNQNSLHDPDSKEVHSNISNTIDNAANFVKESSEAKNILIEKDLTTATFSHDPVMIETVLRNLLNNAIKFSPQGTRIKIRSHFSVNYVIEVHDSAEKLAIEDIERIQSGVSIASKPGTENEKGTGLGLKLIHSFLKAHSGKLEITHNDKGNIFRVVLQNK